MGLRVRESTERHLEALRREGVWLREGEEPLVLPLVVYDGAERWERVAGPLGRLPEVAALALAPLQPGSYLLLDAGAWELEDWPAGNRHGRSEERERLRRELSTLRLDPETAARVPSCWISEDKRCPSPLNGHAPSG